RAANWRKGSFRRPRACRGYAIKAKKAARSGRERAVQAMGSAFALVRSQHAGAALLDELAGGPRAAAAGPNGESLAPGDELVGGDGQLVLFGQLEQDLAVKGLVRPLEG